MPSTSIYGIPYLAPSDPPDIAGLGEGIAEATEDILHDGTQPLVVGSVTTGTVAASGAATVGGNLTVSGIGQMLVAIKTVDTPRDTSTILADPHLTLAVAANAVYIAELSIAWTGGTTPDIQWNFSGPAGATFPRYRHLANDGTAAAVMGISSTLAFVNARSAITGTDYGLDIKGILRTSVTAGNFAFCWGQNVTNAIDTTLYTDSFMRLTRVG